MPNTRLDPEPQPHHGPGAIDLSRGHEHADIRLGGFIKFVAWLVVVSAVLLFACYITLLALDRMENAERRSAAFRPLPRRDDDAKPERALNSNENGEFSRRPTPLQPSPGHPRTDWKDMSLLREQKKDEMDAMGFRLRPESENLWIPQRVIPPLLVEAAAEFVQNMRATTRPATQPAAARTPENGGGS